MVGRSTRSTGRRPVTVLSLYREPLVSGPIRNYFLNMSSRSTSPLYMDDPSSPLNFRSSMKGLDFLSLRRCRYGYWWNSHIGRKGYRQKSSRSGPFSTTVVQTFCPSMSLLKGSCRRCVPDIVFLVVHKSGVGHQDCSQ